MKLKSLIAALSIVGLASAASAAPLTYNVSRALGSSGSVTGTVTTDGTIGVLGTVNVTDWSLTLNDGIDTLIIDNTNSGFLAINAGLTADADSIDFDFSATDVVFLFQNPSVGNGGNNYWCGNGVGDFYCSNGAFGLGAREDMKLTGGVSFVNRSSSVAIATRTVTAPPTGNNVPEPASLALVGLALAGVAAVRRRA